jgi:GT2 family glycosyltransferase
VLTPVHNRAHLIERALERLAENTTYKDTEFIFVDDGSTDGSPEILHRWAAGGRLRTMRVIENSSRGAIAALNTALDAASGEFCVQLDDDVTVETPGWIERMLDLMRVDDSVGVVTAKVVLDSGEIQACGVHVTGPAGWHERSTNPAEPLEERQWLRRTDTRIPEGEGGALELHVAEVDSGIGCCMMYRRADAVAAGGYDDEWSPLWFDDVDLCLKIRAAGRKVFYTPDVRVIHHLAHRWERVRSLPERLGPRRFARALIRRITGRRWRRLLRALESRLELALLGYYLLGYYTKEECALLRHHHIYWQQKWGWDAQNPDMNVIHRRWGDTEICWATDPARRAAGERIADAYRARREERVVLTA